MSALGWQERARCAGAGLEVFFPDGGDTRRAKAFCAGCPVWGQCLAYGLEEDHGVWGGLNRAERARLRRLQQRLAVSPADPANSVDIRRLLSVGLPPERLSEVAGLEVDTIIDRATRGVRRRSPARFRQAVPV
jgi:WhiB family redox-sensing transcriptional regulator